MMGSWHYFIGSAGFIGGWLLTTTIALPLPLKQPEAHSLPTTETVLAHLADGPYQFCTEPVPSDWHDGAGVCLNVLKQGTTLEGYYGYPHSESFICLQGQVFEDELHGHGFTISWPDHPWPELPQSEFNWDEEGRLSLAEASVTRREGDVSWITFQQAHLNMQGLYLYPSARMTPPAQVCSWGSTADL